MRRRTDDDDPIGQPRQQQVGQREVAQVVGGDLGLEPVDRAREGHRHHAGVVDEDVDVPDFLRERAHRLQVGDVEPAYIDAPPQLAGDRSPLLRVPHGQDDLRPERGEDPSRLQTDAAAGPRDDEPASVLARHLHPGSGASAAGHQALDVLDGAADLDRAADRAQSVAGLLHRARQELPCPVAVLPSGKVMSKVSVRPTMWLPCSSRIL